MILRDYQDEVCHEVSMIITTAIGPALVAKFRMKTVIIADQKSANQLGLARELQSQLNGKGYQETMITSLEDLTNEAPKESIYIYLADLENPFLFDLDAETYATLHAMLLSVRNLIWVSGGGGTTTKHPGFGMINGLARVLRNENTNLTIVSVALDPGNQCLVSKTDQIIRVMHDMTRGLNENYEEEYIERDGRLQIGRLVEARYLKESISTIQSLQQTQIQPFGQFARLKLEIEALGSLNTFQFVEDCSVDATLGPNEVEVQVKAAGLNYTDCLNVLGRLNRTWLGAECAGVVTRVGNQSTFRPGDRVAGCSAGTLRTFATLPTGCVTRIPDGWTFDLAASLPTAFTLAYHALCEKAQLKSGDSVLVHCGAGGLGQAAIQIAKHFGANVYATVGSQEKRELVLNLFGLPDGNVFAHDRSFVNRVKQLTNGRGIDIVLNTLGDEQGEESLECVASYGTFLELTVGEGNQSRIMSNASNISIIRIDYASLIQERPDLVQTSFTEAMALLVKGKINPPSPINAYLASNVEDAFRALASRKTAGKTVISFGQNDLVKASRNRASSVFIGDANENLIQVVLDTQKQYHLDPESSYVISGGLGGIGCLAARWMVSRGAKNLILLSRSGARSKEAIELLNDLKAQNARVEAPHCDITNFQTLATVLADCATRLPPIRGCVQAAMVMEVRGPFFPNIASLPYKPKPYTQDLTFESMTHPVWTRVVRPKAQGSHNLHALLPRGLDFFIMLSSMCGIFGNGSQANYAAGNTYQDALARHRIARGEKAVALDLGPIPDLGMLAQNEDIRKRMKAGGAFTMLSGKDVCAQLEHYCDPHLPLLSDLRCQTLSGINVPANIRAQGFDAPNWMQHRSLFAHFHQIEGSSAAGSSVSGSGGGATTTAPVTDMSSALADAASDADAGTLVTEALVGKLARILALPSDALDVQKPIHALGVDSLVAVDIRNWCAKEIKADVAIFDIMGGASLQEIGLRMAGKSLFRVGKAER